MIADRQICLHSDFASSSRSRSNDPRTKDPSRHDSKCRSLEPSRRLVRFELWKYRRRRSTPFLRFQNRIPRSPSAKDERCCQCQHWSYVSDILFSLPFIFTSLTRLVNSITYSKKKDKQASIAFKKDNTIPRDDVYKSSTVSVPQGEPANSQSMPPAERKPRIKKAAAVRSTPNVSLSLSGLLHANSLD